MTLPSDKILESVATVARVLEALADAPQAVGMSDLARRLGLSKARAYRVLASLKEHGLVDQEHATERYRLGWRLVRLGERASAQFDLRRMADPLLAHVRDRTGQSAFLSVPFKNAAVVVAAADAPGGVCLKVTPGHQPAPHGTAEGRITQAWAPVDVAPGARGTPMADAVLRDRLTLIRQRLWDEAPNEALPGINGLAAPVLRDGDVLVGIVSFIGMIVDVPSPPHPAQLALVQGAAAVLSGALGSGRYAQLGIAPSPDLRALVPRRG